MEVFDSHITDRITVRDRKNYIINVPDWYWLSIDKHNPKFDEDFKKEIIDDSVTEAGADNLVETPEIFHSYINMGVGLPRGNGG